MCRLLGYLGTPIQLDKLLYKPEHSLIVQSYQPREMQTALLNADGFGIGWYHSQKAENPYTYRNILPIWSDLNLPQLSRYVESGCVVGYVRSATPGLAVDLSNCQPFSCDRLLFTHNGYIDKFRQTLYRPIRNQLNDATYQFIKGTTDSEHIFALILHELQTHSSLSLEEAVRNTFIKLRNLANTAQVYFCANILISDGKCLVATRYASESPAPSLYWIRDDINYPNAVIVASEPLFDGNWNRCPEQSLISVGGDFEVSIYPIPEKGDS